jgi:RNA-directed DNA polymerase
VNVRNSTTPKGEKRTDKDLRDQWNSIDWKEVRSHVNRLQTRIAKTTHEEKWYLVKRLQYLLTNSYYARLLAVRIVTQNRGSRTPGIDGTRWLRPHEKMRAVLSITGKRYIALLIRLIRLSSNSCWFLTVQSSGS